MSFAGGKLKLKGGKDIKDTLKPSTGGVEKPKKKKKEKRDHAGAEDEATQVAQVIETPQGYILPPRLQHEDRRTDAEKRYANKMEQWELENLRKMAQRSHRDRITQFNE